METETISMSGILGAAEKMAANAKDGTLKVDGVTYQLKFRRDLWRYDVTDDKGAYVINFNTKSLKQAREWLREWLAN